MRSQDFNKEDWKNDELIASAAAHKLHFEPPT